MPLGGGRPQRTHAPSKSPVGQVGDRWYVEESPKSGRRPTGQAGSRRSRGSSRCGGGPEQPSSGFDPGDRASSTGRAQLRLRRATPSEPRRHASRKRVTGVSAARSPGNETGRTFCRAGPDSRRAEPSGSSGAESGGQSNRQLPPRRESGLGLCPPAAPMLRTPERSARVAKKDGNVRYDEPSGRHGVLAATRSRMAATVNSFGSARASRFRCAPRWQMAL